MKHFHLSIVLTLLTGHAFVSYETVRKMVAWMTDEEKSQAQVSLLSVCQRAILKKNPELASVKWHRNLTAEWLRAQEDRFGSLVQVPKLTQQEKDSVVYGHHPGEVILITL